MSSDHVAELGNQRPDKPFFFLKPKSSLVFDRGRDLKDRGLEGKILIPNGVNVHYEVELALHISRRVHHLAYQKTKMANEADWEALWKSCIGGYGIGASPAFRILNRCV